MNQDQARRMAEEVELPEPQLYEAIYQDGSSYSFAPPHKDCPHVVKYWDEADVREAIAAALVKLTQEQEPVGEVVKGQDGWPWVRFSEYQTSEVARLPVGTKLYTHHIPSQQEERKPLTEDQITSGW